MPPFANDIIRRFGRTRAILTIVVAAAGLSLLWAITSWAMAPAWVTLYAGLPLETVAQVTDRLGEAGIAHRLARGGATVDVAERDVARARVLLAQSGIPARGRPGFELFDQPAWGMTDFTQRINYRRALEGELERSIGQMRGIEGAQVHLAMRETSSLRRSERPLEASVLLRLTPGAPLGAEQVEAITFLVASSIEGLSTENISVLDDNGRVHSAAVQPGGAAGASKRHVTLQRETETYLERRAEELLADVVGGGNARVRVAATLNFDRVDRTRMQLDPESQVALREERSEIVPGTREQGAASTTENSTYDVSRTTETLSTQPGGLRRLTVAVLINQGALQGGAAQQSAQLGRIETLVRNAVGVDDVRGDAISVVGVAFEPRATVPFAEPTPIPLSQRLLEFTRPAIGLLAVLLGFFVVLQALRAVRSGTTSAAATPALAAGAVAPLMAPAANPAVVREREQLAALVGERPENATRVIRAWMKDA